ncbi:MAG: fimbria/pilus periplasmic chaperone [Proteobacteria bacterium]|nr:fimbria/pilus periplasmic chaperone [Pseudomonadota bacterium]
MFLVLFLYRFICFSFLVLFVLDGYAVGVSPTRLSLSTKTPIVTLTLTNENKTPLTMQLKLVSWRQDKGKDVYASSYDLIVTPQIFNIPPKGIQLVRLGLDKPLFSNKISAYRLFVDEVVTSKEVKPGQLKMAIRLSIPVIIEPLVPVKQSLIWRREQLKDKTKISVENKGNNIIFISSLQGLTANKKAIMKPLRTFTYLLPGSKTFWLIKASSAHTLSSIKASVNSEIVLANVS